MRPILGLVLTVIAFALPAHAQQRSAFADRGTKASISLRFLERLANPEAASERGIFEFTNDGRARRHAHHLRQVPRDLAQGGRALKIPVDCDSSEGGTIDRASSLAAHAPDDHARY